MIQHIEKNRDIEAQQIQPLKDKWTWKKAIIPTFILGLITCSVAYLYTSSNRSLNAETVVWRKVPSEPWKFPNLYKQFTPPSTSFSSYEAPKPLINPNSSEFTVEQADRILLETEVLMDPKLETIVKTASSGALASFIKREDINVLNYLNFDVVFEKLNRESVTAFLSKRGILEQRKFPVVFQKASKEDAYFFIEVKGLDLLYHAQLGLILEKAGKGSADRFLLGDEVLDHPQCKIIFENASEEAVDQFIYRRFQTVSTHPLFSLILKNASSQMQQKYSPESLKIPPRFT